MQLEVMGKAAQEASYQLLELNAPKKNKVLAVLADLLQTEGDFILKSNNEDVETARVAGMGEAMLDRLRLTPSRLAELANNVRDISQLPDPVGHVIDGGLMDNGLSLIRRRVPLGVVAVIYESRPNVTIDVTALCLKTGNAVILRGGKETINTNRALVAMIQQALECTGLPIAAVQFIDDPERSLVHQLLKLDAYVDMLIPRGGASLHQLCREHATIPVITGGIGVCHIFADRSCDVEKSLAIIENAKIQRPSTCNSVETLLVHQAIAANFLPELAKRMDACQVFLHACPISLPLLQPFTERVLAISPEEFDREWLSLDLNVKVVENLNVAITHIRQHSTGHSEAILTRSLSHAERFVRMIDSAAVYVNASTRFSDGGEFGLGAEVAISTQKLHARGPMGLEALTTYKWIGYGDDLIRR